MVGSQVREVYADLASLVDEQKASVDQIETDATDAHTRTANGIEQVIQKETSTRRARAATPRDRVDATAAASSQRHDRVAHGHGASRETPSASARDHACVLGRRAVALARVAARALGRRTVASVLRPRR